MAASPQPASVRPRPPPRIARPLLLFAHSETRSLVSPAAAPAPRAAWPPRHCPRRRRNFTTGPSPTGPQVLHQRRIQVLHARSIASPWSEREAERDCRCWRHHRSQSSRPAYRQDMKWAGRTRMNAFMSRRPSRQNVWRAPSMSGRKYIASVRLGRQPMRDGMRIQRREFLPVGLLPRRDVAIAGAVGFSERRFLDRLDGFCRAAPPKNFSVFASSAFVASKNCSNSFIAREGSRRS
jgi:hypothetical protein